MVNLTELWSTNLLWSTEAVILPMRKKTVIFDVLVS